MARLVLSACSLWFTMVVWWRPIHCRIKRWNSDNFGTPLGHWQHTAHNTHSPRFPREKKINVGVKCKKLFRILQYPVTVFFFLLLWPRFAQCFGMSGRYVILGDIVISLFGNPLGFARCQLKNDRVLHWMQLPHAKVENCILWFSILFRIAQQNESCSREVHTARRSALTD